MDKPTKSPKTIPAEYSLEDLLAWPRDRLENLEPGRLIVSSPAAVGSFLERLDVDERRTVLRLLPDEEASDILAEMDAPDSAEVVAAMREPRALNILEELEPDDAADVMAELEETDRSRLMGKLESDTAKIVESLLSYDPETAGGVMTPECATIAPEMTVDQAIEQIRRFYEETEQIYAIYVVNQEHLLQGIVAMRDLILAKPDQKIEDIMNSKVKGKCSPGMDREEVALSLAEHNLLALPVVDADGKLLGMVTHDDVVDILQDEATEDIQILVGAGADESIHDEITYSMRRRRPWLQVNLLTAFLAAGVVYMFADQIEKLAMLAVLMPVIASMGGNTGSQALAVAIRSMSLGEVHLNDAGRLCRKELTMGLINGSLIGLLAGLLTYLVLRDVKISLVVFAAIILNMGLAGLAGATIPLLLKKFNYDPAQGSSIFLTTLTDIAGFFIFLSLGSWLLL